MADHEGAAQTVEERFDSTLDSVDEAEETEVVHHIAQSILQVLTRQCQCSLELTFSDDVIFSLVGKKPLELAQKSIGHGTHQVLDNRSCSLYLPLRLRPLALRSEEEYRPRIGGS